MKKLTILFISLLICLVGSVFVFSQTAYTIPADYRVDTDDDAVNYTNVWKTNFDAVNISDLSITTYALPSDSLSDGVYYYVNYSRINYNESVSSATETQYIYKDSSGNIRSVNITMSSFPACFRSDLLGYRVMLNGTNNVSNKVENELFTPLNGIAINLDNTFIQTSGFVVFNKTRGHKQTNQSFTWLNGTANALSAYSIVAGSLTVFNQTAAVRQIVNESGSDWIEGVNITLLNQNIVSTTVYKCNGSVVITSTNYTLFKGDGKILAVSNDTVNDNTPVCMNYTYSKPGDNQIIGSGNYTINYTQGNITFVMTTGTFDNTYLNNTQLGANYTFNRTYLYGTGNYTIGYDGGNITLGTAFLNNTELAINYTYDTRSLPTNTLSCLNTTSGWEEMRTSSGYAEVYDLRLYWYLTSRDVLYDWTIERPDEYKVFNYSVINFNTTLTDTGSNENQTLFNCSLWTRISNTDNYTVNISNIATTNASHFNVSIHTADGDRMWWYESCQDNYGRVIANTSVRVFDVDISYSTLVVDVTTLNITGNLQVMGCIKNSTGDRITGVCV